MTGPQFGVIVQSALLVVLADLWIHDITHVGVVAFEGAGVTLRGMLLEPNHEIGVVIAGSAKPG